MTNEEQSPLEVLQDAVQEFVNSISDKPCVVTGAVVAWETREFKDDGDLLFEVNYSSLPPTSMATAVGIFDIALEKLHNDIGDRHDE